MVQFIKVWDKEDGAPITAIQIKGEMKKDIKKFIWKGD